jgi:hypothetical protein
LSGEVWIVQHEHTVENKRASIAETMAERRSALALVRLLLYAADEADELGLPDCATLVNKAAADVTTTFGLTEEEIAAFPS